MKTNLQYLRKKAGFRSARAFADHIGMNAKTYTNYEQGVRSMDLETAWNLADALECTLDELSGRTACRSDKDQGEQPGNERLTLSEAAMKVAEAIGESGFMEAAMDAARAKDEEGND